MFDKIRRGKWNRQRRDQCPCTAQGHSRIKVDVCVEFMKEEFFFAYSYLLYVDGETALSGGCLFTFGLTLLTCLMEFACILTDCCCCSCCCCCWCWFCCCCCSCCCCCCGPINCGCCCALSCCDEPVIPPFERRFRFITESRHHYFFPSY